MAGFAVVTAGRVAAPWIKNQKVMDGPGGVFYS